MSMQPDGLRLPREGEEFTTVQDDFQKDIAGFRQFTPELGAPVGGDEDARNFYIRNLIEGAANQGWTVVGESAYPTPESRADLRFAYAEMGGAGAPMPIAIKRSETVGGNEWDVLYSDGTIRNETLRARGGGSGAGTVGGGGGGGGAGSVMRAGIAGTGSFENAASQFAMGGDGSPGSRAARDAAILLARQYGFDASFFSQIENLLYEGISEDSLTLALRQTEAYKKRFAANETRVKKGLPALSEAEYIRMEQLYRQELRAAGMPPEFYDDMNDFKKYIENDLSYNEFVSRVGLATRASQTANPEVKQQLKDLYGVGEEQLVAYFLNPEKTTALLQKQFNVAQTAGALTRSGFGTAMAEELTTSVLGGAPSTTLNYGELEKATQTAAAFRPLAGQVLGGERGAVTEQELLRGVVAEDVQSQRQLQREQQRRLAEYQGGGSLAQAQQGIVGLRSAAR